MGESSSAIKVLVVDDEPQIVRALRINLTARGYNVVTAGTGTGALRAIASEHPDVVILDLGLPDIGGLDVLAGVRGWSEVPVIVLSARTDSGDKIEALDAGADDYITKPFGMDEFLARLRVAVRRRAIRTSPTDPLVTTSSFTIDLASKRVTRDGEIVHLTRTEWGVLEMLARNAGKLVGQKELLRTVWGPGHDHGSNYLRIYMSQLRRKLEIDPGKPRHLITETGMGYRLVE
ncbi:response regulator [Rhodococcus sp. IEGM 1330]|uniref:response regulator n=1 Tax=Rhodococcus sp. IEGM 1330 TaxID=3082225 RepID=UPI002954B2CB|nr:response regulator [Rhodococcus sp. IEGM 1330]MDV8024821.1 response regulator [Rhodococcus sp. IEGM 1330]